jgi:hypothetical protein
MPAIAQFTLDGISGADHVFNPDNVTNNVVTWLKSGTSPVGDERFTMRTSKTPTGKVKSTIKLVLPKTQDVEISGVTRPTVVSTAVIDISFTSDATAPNADRYEMLDLIRSIFDYSKNPDLSNSVALGQAFY